MKRKRMNRRSSRKSFKNGMGVHKKNLKKSPYRGGIRL